MKFDFLCEKLIRKDKNVYNLFEGVHIGKPRIRYAADPEGAIKLLGQDMDAIKNDPNDSRAAGEIYRILEDSNFLPRYRFIHQGKKVSYTPEQIFKRIFEYTRKGGVKLKNIINFPDPNNPKKNLPSDNSFEKLEHLNIFQFGQSGGYKPMAHVYEMILNHLNRPWKSYRRRQDTPIDRNLKKDVIYWWGVDGKPYSTALKVDQNGHIKGGAFWREDRFEGKMKPAPVGLSGMRTKAALTPEELKVIIRVGEYYNYLWTNNKKTFSENPEIAFKNLYKDPKYYTVR